MYLPVPVNSLPSICSQRTFLSLTFSGAPPFLPFITGGSHQVVEETNPIAANAVFNLPPVLVPEAVQPLVGISTIFLGI